MRRLKFTNSPRLAWAIVPLCLTCILSVAGVPRVHAQAAPDVPEKPDHGTADHSTCPPNKTDRNAPPKPPGRRSGFNPFSRDHDKMEMWRVVQLPTVRKELNFSNEEMKQLQDLREEVRQMGGSPERTEWRRLNDDEKRAKHKELIELGRKRRIAFETKLKAILPDEKFRGIQEIRIQLMGMMALFDNEVFEELSMSEEQASQIESVMKKSMHDAMRNYFKSEKKVSMREHMRETIKAIDKKVLEMLKPQQAAKLAELKGEPIEIDYDELKRVDRPSRRRRDPPPRRKPDSESRSESESEK